MLPATLCFRPKDDASCETNCLEGLESSSLTYGQHDERRRVRRGSDMANMGRRMSMAVDIHNQRSPISCKTTELVLYGCDERRLCQRNFQGPTVRTS